jgi:hypothetical protein
MVRAAQQHGPRQLAPRKALIWRKGLTAGGLTNKGVIDRGGLQAKQEETQGINAEKKRTSRPEKFRSV